MSQQQINFISHHSTINRQHKQLVHRTTPFITCNTCYSFSCSNWHDIFRSIQSAYDKIGNMLCGVYDNDCLLLRLLKSVSCDDALAKRIKLR